VHTNEKIKSDTTYVIIGCVIYGIQLGLGVRGLWVSIFDVFWVLFGVVVLSGGFFSLRFPMCVCVCVCVRARARARGLAHLVYLQDFFFILSNATTCPCGLRGPPSWAWQQCNRLLRLLRCPDDVSGDIGGWSARRALKPKFYQPTQTLVTAGILPFRDNSHGRVANRTRDLMISSPRL